MYEVVTTEVKHAHKISKEAGMNEQDLEFPDNFLHCSQDSVLIWDTYDLYLPRRGSACSVVASREQQRLIVLASNKILRQRRTES